MPEPRLATIDDADLLARVAASGFYDDPVLSWVLPDASKRLAQLVFLFDTMVRDMLPVGGTVHLLDDASAAFWRSPDYVHGRTSSDRARDREAEDPGAPSPLAPDELERLATLGQAIMAGHPHEPHWYLNVVSTLPERQGGGLGAAVLQPVLAMCDAQGIAAYLESSNPRNMSLYRRQGFVETGEIQLPDGPSLYPMWREPAAVVR
ncbi:MAG: GNAT family N-acetyltransferase [Actinomycetota bacterium]